ncbi:D-2-hydroxyacid dehydrogenase family protein [Bordetella sp. N]|uniref:D-2-hydroxyacid dehydrogenase family protein n=1 Tax=Bordetella sp. N TaxID=1746199 RepID=UPI00070C3249|nr:D-2-hydroxyacid dehydrogenase family protein [Bordetella sp. N]ALM83598.1 hydroxyacid dehydrogenase [Bordetella sp. N]
MLRIAILDDYQGIALRCADWAPLRDRCELAAFSRHLDPHSAAEALQDFDVICLMRERMAVPDSLLAQLPRLRCIVMTGTRNPTLDIESAGRRGIVVTHTTRRGVGLFSTAELAWGLILALARHIPYENARMREGHWQSSCGVALAGRRLGLLGLGKLGAHMVPVAKAFQMEVIAWSQNLTDERAMELGVKKVTKAELFSTSDFLSLHLVLSERTRHIIGEQELRLMPKNSYLINTSRGGLVDTAALVDTLENCRIAGAALDTFEQEPLPADSELRKLSNVVLTPHLGYTVEELLRAYYEDCVECVTRWLDGAPVRVLT